MFLVVVVISAGLAAITLAQRMKGREVTDNEKQAWKDHAKKFIRSLNTNTWPFRFDHLMNKVGIVPAICCHSMSVTSFPVRCTFLVQEVDRIEPQSRV